MDTLQTAQIVIGSIIGLGALIAGTGYGYAQFFKGRSDKTKDDFERFNTQLDALRKICDDQANQITKLQDDLKTHTREIGILEGVNQEKEKKIKELTDLLANRDPALSEYIKFSREVLTAVQTYLQGQGTAKVPAPGV